MWVFVYLMVYFKIKLFIIATMAIEDNEPTA